MILNLDLCWKATNLELKLWGVVAGESYVWGQNQARICFQRVKLMFFEKHIFPNLQILKKNLERLISCHVEITMCYVFVFSAKIQNVFFSLLAPQVIWHIAFLTLTNLIYLEDFGTSKLCNFSIFIWFLAKTRYIFSCQLKCSRKT